MPIISNAPADNFISFGDGNRSWENTDRIKNLDGQQSRCNTKNSKGDEARSLVAREFLFPTFPKYSVIKGIQFDVWRRQSDNNTTSDEVVRLVVSNTIVGQNKASGVNWPTSTTQITYGGESDTWSLTETQLNNILDESWNVRNDFGILFRPITETGSTFSANRSNLFVDYLTITLYAEVRECYTYINGEWVKITPEIKISSNSITSEAFIRINGEWQEVFII